MRQHVIQMLFFQDVRTGQMGMVILSKSFSKQTYRTDQSTSLEEIDLRKHLSASLKTLRSPKINSIIFPTASQTQYCELRHTA
jgi:hypothetical protein